MARRNFWVILRKGVNSFRRLVDDIRYKRTPLIKAVRDLDVKKVERILHECDVNEVDKYKNNVLMYLLDKDIKNDTRVKRIMDMLIAAEINLDNVNLQRETVLIKACKNKKFDIAKYLVGKGADVTIEDKEGKRAIHYVIDNEEMRRILSDANYKTAGVYRNIPQGGFEDGVYIPQYSLGDLQIKMDVSVDPNKLAYDFNGDWQDIKKEENLEQTDVGKRIDEGYNSSEDITEKKERVDKTKNRVQRDEDFLVIEDEFNVNWDKISKEGNNPMKEKVVYEKEIDNFYVKNKEFNPW